jgi:hypothetical protein
MTAGQLRGKRRGARALFGGSLLLAFALQGALLAGAGPAMAETSPVRVSTGGVSHVRGTSAQLNGVLIANNVTATVYFEYGPTLAYGTKSKTLTIAPPNPPPATPKSVKIGVPVLGLLPNWHYRICATYTPAQPPVCGKDKSFSGGKASQLKFVLGKGKEDRLSVTYGGTLELAGSLSGKNNANHGLALQATPFPYTSPFAAIGGTVLSSRTGSFLFRVARITQDTQLRILTVDTRPLYSPVVTVHVSPRITLHVRSAGKTGLYRLYGTVSPARTGAQLTIQQLVPQKASSKREGPATHSVGATTLKHATKSMSRFSLIVSLSGNFRYRAFVKLPKGAIESGHSANLLIKAPAAKSGHRHRKK